MKALIEIIMSLFSSKKKEEKKQTSVDVVHIKEYEKENVAAKKETVKKNIVIEPIQMKNDSKRLKTEYKQLMSKNMYMYNLLTDLNSFTQKQFKKGLVITMIFRTDAEQDYLYANSAKYQKRKFKSPHQFWHAVDVRSKTFTQAEIKKMVDYLNKKHNGPNYYKWTAKCHSIGHGMHFHIQFAKK